VSSLDGLVHSFEPRQTEWSRVHQPGYLFRNPHIVSSVVQKWSENPSNLSLLTYWFLPRVTFTGNSIVH
jgi:hypothetical protein